ncbi:uncharacterized protein LOC122238463 isoform X1 [Panthera tigris]|uniref:uncharacterized protein LOC122238463 isoform X1 n=1 Tax=Panthera tigris TaxID=9694 RepID=UPI001C6F9E31|nr:uncharacterized protein LOC122238463 isoform X1 [Panthera tigris]XP_042841307.1 uncharacterized protein LOC122238463 isoform X1 [Panthera tigris]XP_042841308.1 uncharacterized protein LOC122238463 isoform X1 [Panthera tigris]
MDGRTRCLEYVRRCVQGRAIGWSRHTPPRRLDFLRNSLALSSAGDSAGKAPRETWGGISHRAAGPTSTISRLPALSLRGTSRCRRGPRTAFNTAQQAVLTQGCADPAVLHSEVPTAVRSMESKDRHMRCVGNRPVLQECAFSERPGPCCLSELGPHPCVLLPGSPPYLHPHLARPLSPPGLLWGLAPTLLAMPPMPSCHSSARKASLGHVTVLRKALPARTFSAPSSGRTFRERTALSDPHR